MGATEDAFYALARSRGIRLERRATFSGLSNRGHADAALGGRVASSTLAALQTIYDELGGTQDLLDRKRIRPLEIDFYAPDLGLLIEIDEVQHFTTDRELALGRFPAGDDRAGTVSRYLGLIERWRRRADQYRATKSASDFPFPGGRRAQRAYFDSARDLLLPELGLRLLRVPAPECDPLIALERFEQR